MAATVELEPGLYVFDAPISVSDPRLQEIMDAAFRTSDEELRRRVHPGEIVQGDAASDDDLA